MTTSHGQTHTIKNAASTNYTGFEAKSDNHKGQSNKDFSRLVSATSQYQAKAYSNYYMNKPHAILQLNASQKSSQGQRIYQTLPKSGVKAIDSHYATIREDIEVNSIRQCTEYQRIVQMIIKHWKAYQFPMCEQKYVMGMLDKWYLSPSFNLVQESLVDQLEDYLKFIKQFSAILG